MSRQGFQNVWASSPASGSTLLAHLALADIANESGVRPPYPPGQNGGVGQTTESLEKIRAIEVMTDRSSSRAATYVLLCHTPQLADLRKMRGLSASRLRKLRHQSGRELVQRKG